VLPTGHPSRSALCVRSTLTYLWDECHTATITFIRLCLDTLSLEYLVHRRQLARYLLAISSHYLRVLTHSLTPQPSHPLLTSTMAGANNLIPHVASLGINGLNGFDSSTNGLNGFDNGTSPTGDSWLSDQSKVTPTNTYPSRCYSALILPARADPNPPHHSPG
jgi:hypothetical protein